MLGSCPPAKNTISRCGGNPRNSCALLSMHFHVIGQPTMSTQTTLCSVMKPTSHTRVGRSCQMQTAATSKSLYERTMIGNRLGSEGNQSGPAKPGATNCWRLLWKCLKLGHPSTEMYRQS